MPFVDNIETPNIVIRDKYAMEDFGEVLEQNGWTRIKSFYKVVVGRKTDNPGSYDPTYYPITTAVAKHVHFKNAKGRILGIAEVIPEKKSLTPTFTFTDEVARANYETMIKGTFDTNKIKGLLYFYTIEKDSPMEDGELSITFPIQALKGDKNYATALDAEIGKLTMFPKGTMTVGSANWDGMDRSANVDGIKENAKPSVMQSPIVPVELYNPINEADAVNNVYSELNKWDDSNITIQGRIDSNSIFVVLQSDTSPDYAGNRVPTVPLFFGEVETEKGHENTYVLFGGVTPTNTTFDYKSDAEYKGTTLIKLVVPPLKSYPNFIGDGVNTGIISKTPGGARYQGVYLSWGTSSESMPPNRTNSKGQSYPRTWDMDVKKYGFNPSKYSGSIHTSYIYVIHPEVGVVGKLRNLVGLQTFSTNNPELRIRREDCPVKVTDSYQCLTLSAISPMTKSPGTPYFLSGVAVRKGTIGSPSYTQVPDPTEVEIDELDVNVYNVSWEIKDDFHHEGVSIDVNGIEVIPIVSGTNSYILDLELYPEISGEVVSEIGVTSINVKGNKSNRVAVTV